MKKLRFLKFIPIALAILAVISLIVMLLWNALIPDIFKGPSLTYFQAIGLFILTKILFVLGPGNRSHFKGRHEYWRKRMEEKWEKMTPEEREKWKNECWGPWRYHDFGSEAAETGKTS